MNGTNIYLDNISAVTEAWTQLLAAGEHNYSNAGISYHGESIGGGK